MFWPQTMLKYHIQQKMWPNSLKKVASEWKITAVVSDNAANMRAGIRLTGWKQLPCFVHTLNLVVTDSIRSDIELSRLQSKCCEIVKYFKQSSVANNKLSELQRQIRGGETKLIQDVIDNKMEQHILHV